MSIVLDSLPNENYEPSEMELVEYGKWLGMDLPLDKPFLWIAREGLKAPLPEHWKACRSEKGELYYFNFKTGESNWDHPLDEHFRELLQREKANPSPQSVASGAKKNVIEANSKEENAAEKKKVKDQRRSSSGGKSKIQTLKSLKLKKELPEDLRIDFKAGSISSSDSSAHSGDTVRLKDNSPPGGSPALQRVTETLRFESEPDFLESDKKTFVANLDDQLKRFQNERLKEHQLAKEEYEARLKDSWKNSQKRLEDEYERKANTLKADLEKKLHTEKRNLEEKYTANIQKLSDELTTGYEREAKRIRQFLNEKQQKERCDAEQRWKSEMDELAKKKSMELEKLRSSESQTLKAMKKITGELKEEASTFVDTYKQAHEAFARVMLDTSTTYLKLGEGTLAQLIDRAEKSYDNGIMKIKDCYESEIEQIKRKYATDVFALKQDQEKFIQEKEKYEKEYMEFAKERTVSLNERITKPSLSRTTQEGQKSHHNPEQVFGPIESDPVLVPEMRGNSKEPEMDPAGAQSEKRLLESVVAYMKESQKKELEEVKKDLKRHTEEELKAALDEIMQERRQVMSGSLPEEKDGTPSLRDSGKVPIDIKTGAKDSERSSTVSPEAIMRDDLTAVVTEALRAVFAGSPFIIPSPTSGDSAGMKRPSTSEPLSTPPGNEAKTLYLEKSGERFPVSFQEQKTLLEGERHRVAQGKKFVENQRLSLEERRYQLKLARHQWKHDVMLAKQDGIRSSSRRGQLLNKLRFALESQARGLEHDEAILRDSERWLLMKEQSVYQMEQQLSELEEGKERDMSTNSVDTVALMTGFFKPALASANLYPQGLDTMQGVTHTPSLSPAYTKALDKIAKRLEEVTSMMNLQQRKRTFSLPHGNLRRRRSEQKPAKDVEVMLNDNGVF
ncbi:hypothetical protein DQ04_09941000 [Trypanosoma grayi]|uniref:hypothetical protein n=1 Tax=Trypanosoma grayi TaxID=71804 RepID=UPI0004F41A9A|nr:hypothetical protein DQ04_09941000 [Trypanosoma grayi]KEG07391.1 hypothetical protein DQ04_09941000 [Trypanosoma grayi]